MKGLAQDYQRFVDRIATKGSPGPGPCTSPNLTQLFGGISSPKAQSNEHSEPKAELLGEGEALRACWSCPSTVDCFSAQLTCPCLAGLSVVWKNKLYLPHLPSAVFLSPSIGQY